MTREPQVDLIALLDDLEALVVESPTLPLTDRALMTRETALEIISALREAIPQTIAHAEQIMREREHLLEQARKEANHILELARQQSEYMVKEHHLTKTAELEAERIMNRARDEAREVRAAAEQYTQRLFDRLVDEALRVAGEVRRAAARQS